MEKTVTILSAGPGGREQMSVEAARLAEEADYLIGAARLVEAWPGKKTAAEYRPEKIRQIVEESDARAIAVLVSGDAGFFSGAGAIARALEHYRPAIVPGISSMAAFSAKLGIPYSGANSISAHGRDINIVSEVRRHRVTFVLGGGNLQALIERLDTFHMNEVQICVGEKLGYPEERIVRGTPSELKEQPFAALAVMAVINEKAHAPAAASIPDEQMIRGSVPMTKELVRAAAIRRLELREDSIVYDIGAGTGAVAVEAALNAWRGTVYAFDHKEEAVELIRRNALQQKADNVVAVRGEAPAILQGYPLPDAVFIGGSDGKLEEILDALPVAKKAGEGSSTVRIVISAVTLQTLEKAADLMKRLAMPEGEEVRISQISENRLVKTGRYDMFRPETPVFLISANVCREEPQGRHAGH